MEPETPLRTEEVPGGPHGQLVEARVASGPNWRVSITQHDDGFARSQEYGVVVNGHVATVSVSERGAVTLVRNQQGMVGSEGQAFGQALVRAVDNAIASGGISPAELNILAGPTQSISALDGAAPRISQTRGGPRVSQTRGGGQGL